jgi:NADH-quinone oxidoreductase subunit L
MHTVGTGGKVLLAVLTTALGLGGLVLGFRIWGRSAEHDALEPTVLRRAWFIDDTVYPALIEQPGEALAEFSAEVVDTEVIDGAVNGVATLVRSGAGQLRKLQTGYVRNYALGVAAGSMVLLAYVLVRAR